MTELNRRLAAIMHKHGIEFSDLMHEGRHMLLLNSGVEHPLTLARRGNAGKITPTKKVDQIIRYIREQQIGVFAFDPLVEFHEANENDNVEMKTVAAIARRIAIEGNCAVLVVGHTRKPPEADSAGFAGNMDTMRGAGSQMFTMRLAFTLHSMSAKDAKEFKVSIDERRFYLRLDDGVKPNLMLPGGEPQWLKRETVAIGNGENVGVLTPVHLDRKSDGKEDLLHDVFELMGDSDKLQAAEMRRRLCDLPMRANDNPDDYKMPLSRAFTKPVTQNGVTITLHRGRGKQVLTREVARNSNHVTSSEVTVTSAGNVE